MKGEVENFPRCEGIIKKTIVKGGPIVCGEYRWNNRDMF